MQANIFTKTRKFHQIFLRTSDPGGAFEPQNRGRKSHDTVTVRRSLSFITFKEQFGHGWFSILCVNSAEYSYWKYYKKIRRKKNCF